MALEQLPRYLQSLGEVAGLPWARIFEGASLVLVKA